MPIVASLLSSTLAEDNLRVCFVSLGYHQHWSGTIQVFFVCLFVCFCFFATFTGFAILLGKPNLSIQTKVHCLLKCK